MHITIMINQVQQSIEGISKLYQTFLFYFSVTTISQSHNSGFIWYNIQTYSIFIHQTVF